MSACRLCGLSDPHVHVSENVVAAVRLFNTKRKKLKLRKITNVDWSIPAINYAGAWYQVSIGLLEEIWPLVRAQIKRSGLRPPEQDQQDEGVEAEGD